MGKEKYGGPFREEEVEGVKTVLRLLPMLICVTGYAVAWDNINFPSCLSGALEEKESGVIYPCFSKYIPSMLKRISLGLSFVFISTLSYLILVLIGNENKRSSSYCLLNSEAFDEALVPINYMGFDSSINMWFMLLLH